MASDLKTPEPSLLRVVLTGGIATGKSSFLKRLLAQRPEIGLYDCDASVHQLLTEAPVMARLRALFGGHIFNDGVLDRSALRQVVFADESHRRQLESLLHPLVRTRAEESFAAYSAEHAEGLFITDVPLYFETHGAYPNDLVAVVATTRPTQKRRLMERSKLSSPDAEAILEAQLPIGEKALLSDVLIWNEGPLARLEDQVQWFLRRLDA